MDMSKLNRIITMHENIEELLKAQELRRVSLNLPRFKVKNTFDLELTLRKMGLESFFSSNDMDLSGMFIAAIVNSKRVSVYVCFTQSLHN